MKRAPCAIVLLVLLSLVTSLVTWETSASDPRPSGDGPWVVRVYFSHRQVVDEIAAWREPWEVNYEQGYLVIEVTPAEYDDLVLAGYRVEVDPRLTAELNRPLTPLPDQVTGIPGYPCYRTVEETFATAQAIVADYPELATWIDIGDSWEKKTAGGNPGYDMMVLRLTNAAISGPKPKLFVMSAIHAREYTTAELMTRFAEYLVANYQVDADITWLLDYHEIHLLLQSNPDGRKKAETGLSWRKNTNENYCSPTSNYRGADLNRNFEFLWGCCGGSSGNQCDETYRGPTPASEPEVQAVQAYVVSQFPDQRDDPLGAAAPVTATGVFMDIHSYSELVLWSWGFTATPTGNGTALQTLGRKFAYYNHYSPDPSWTLYTTDGTTDDFAYGELGLAAYTFELGTSFFQSCSTFENIILPDNMPALIYAAKAARTPYLTPAGPDATDLTVTPAGAAPGTPVTLRAWIDDTRYYDDNGTEPTQTVVAAEAYLDVPPWVTGTVPIPISLAPADGTWDSTREEVMGTIDTAGLAQGKHLVYVRGQDANGNWGVVSAVFLYLLDPQVAPVIQGYVRSAQDNAPLEATVEAGIFQAQTDPTTGYYEMMVISDTYDLAVSAADHAATTVAGIAAQNHQTVRQDLFLYPVCSILADDVEGGNIGWTAQSPWAITSEASHSPTHSWTDSPGGNYSNYRNVSLTSPALDLSGYEGVELGFWHIYDIEPGYDYGYVEYSTNGGGTWAPAASYDGYDQITWTAQELALPALNGQANGRLRFRFYSDSYVYADGWHIDDISLTGGGPACVTPISPTAEFVLAAPAVQGREATFVNLVHGTPSLAFQWDFGDGVGTSTESHPAYIYQSAGTYTVTLAVTNSLGSDSVSHLVDVTQCEPLTGVSLTQVTPGPIYAGSRVDLSADLSDGASLPYTYTVDYGDGTPVTGASGSDDPLSLSHVYVASGTYTVTLSAWNCDVGTPVSDTLAITVQQPPSCIELSAVEILGPAAGEPGFYTFTLAYQPITATWPITYRWDNGDAGDTSVRSLGVGTHTLALTATNCAAALVTDTHQVVITPTPVCTEVLSVDLTWLGTGTIYTDTLVPLAADMLPDDATRPLSYTIDYGDGTLPVTGVTSHDPLTLTHTFAATGTYTAEIGVWNCSLTLPVTDTLELTVVARPRPHSLVYLPLLRKGD